MGAASEVGQNGTCTVFPGPLCRASDRRRVRLSRVRRGTWVSVGATGFEPATSRTRTVRAHPSKSFRNCQPPTVYGKTVVLQAVANRCRKTQRIALPRAGKRYQGVTRSRVNLLDFIPVSRSGLAP